MRNTTRRRLTSHTMSSESATTPFDDPRFAPLVARTRLVEERYKEIEAAGPSLQPLSDEQIAEMNKSLGFRPEADNYKGQDYRPYCIRGHCEFSPRMYRIPDGFRCWSCGNQWIINTEE